MQAYRDEFDRLWVWCEHELRWHRHPASYCDHDAYPCPCVGNLDGWRSAHCLCDASPLLLTGYVLREVGLLTPEIEAAHPEVADVYGCWSDGSRLGCRLDREARRDWLAESAQWLPGADQPYRVAHALAKTLGDVNLAKVAPDHEIFQPWWWLPHTRSEMDDLANAHRALRRDREAPDALQSDDESGERRVEQREFRLHEDRIRDEPYSAEVHGPALLRHWRGEWWEWAQTHWTRVEHVQLTSRFYQLLDRARWRKVSADGGAAWVPWKPNSRSINEVLGALAGIALVPERVDAPSWLRYTPQVVVAQAEGDAPAWVMGPPQDGLIAVQNGLLDPVKRELHPHTPDYWNTSVVPIAFNIKAPEPTAWLRFLAELWPEDPESIQTLREWFGYVLSGRTDFQKMLLVVGPPRAGKGTIVRILQELVGVGNYAGPTLASLNENFGLQSLIGKQLAVVADARLAGTTNTVVERLLSITGEDTLTVDRKHKDPWVGRIGARVVILSNELPHFGDVSGAVVSRFVTLELTRSWLGHEDIDLYGRLRAELPGILLWALDGLADLDHRGRFTEPESSRDAVAAMAADSSPHRTFVAECCELDPAYQVSCRDLFTAWRGWCVATNRRKTGTEQAFGRDLRSVLPGLRVSRPRDAAGNRLRLYVGIRVAGEKPRADPRSTLEPAS